MGGIFRHIRIGRLLGIFGSAFVCASFVFAASQSITIEVLPLGSPTETPSPSPTPTPTQQQGGGGGGGGGGFVPQPTTRVIFNGRAYPNNTVTVLKDAQVVATTVAGPDAVFQAGISGISAGNYLFSLYAEDDQGRRSSLSTFPISVTQGALTSVSGIFIAPTFDTDKTQVKQGDTITLFGKSTQNAAITIQVNSDQPLFFNTKADQSGAFLYKLDTARLSFGQHTSKAKAATADDISEYSQVVTFAVGTTNVQKVSSAYATYDLNADKRVNLVDLSIELYWYKKPLTQDARQKYDFNNDNIVNLQDVSILLYYWTG